MRVLLTGASGFVGSFMQHILPCIALASTKGVEVDLRKAADVRAAIRGAVPDVVIHLAAQSFVPRSFEDPDETYQTNFLGTFNLLDALKREGFLGTFLFVGSGDIYGVVPAEELPIMEDRVLRPRNPYAVSKVAAEALCFQWSFTEPFKIVMARPFNHIGPGQREEFVVSGFAKQIVEIKKGRRDATVRVGDIDVTRDFTDVRDIVLAYKALVENGESGETYNVCSGQEFAIRDILARLIDIAGVKVTVEPDPALLRPVQQRRQVGCYSKLRRATGWKPSIQIDQSLQEILVYWEKILV